MEEKAQKLDNFRMFFSLTCIALIVFGAYLVFGLGKFTFTPSISYSSLPCVISGSVICGFALITLIVSQVIINSKLGKLRMAKEEENNKKNENSDKLNKYQAAKIKQAEYKKNKKK